MIFIILTSSIKRRLYGWLKHREAEDPPKSALAQVISHTIYDVILVKNVSVLGFMKKSRTDLGIKTIKHL